MKTLLNLEEIAKFVASYIGSLYLGFEWWIFPAFLLLPDLSMLGYLVNTHIGAIVYNIFHHQAFAIAVGTTGLVLNLVEWQLAGLVLFGHSSMDRALGYGLKYSDSFQHTHLGTIGKNDQLV